MMTTEYDDADASHILFAFFLEKNLDTSLSFALGIDSLADAFHPLLHYSHELISDPPCRGESTGRSVHL